MSKCCECPCAQANAFAQKAYVFSVGVDAVEQLVNTLTTARTAAGNLLNITMMSVDGIQAAATLAVATSTTVGTVYVTIALDLKEFSAEAKLNQVQTVMDIANVFGSCLQEIEGFVATSNVGTAIQLIASVASQAAAANANLSKINALFCESNPPVPVKVFFASKKAELLVNIINLGLYICTGDPANPN
jgi:hypothetical protein